MNCCDQSLPKGNGCNQGRQCPVRGQVGSAQPVALPGAARVAVAKPLYRRCDVAGVCQSPDASCLADCLLASPPVASGQDDALGDTAMRVVLVLLGLLTLVVLAGVAGFAWEQRASWQAAWAALQDTLWALAARWS
jgi:hypothetical protein